MSEEFIIGLVLLVLALGAVGGILGIIGFARSLRLGGLARRIEALERGLRAPPRAPSETPAVSPALVPVAPRAPPAQIPPAPEPPRPQPVPVPVAAPAPRPEPAPVRVEPPEPVVAPPPLRARIEWERLVGVRGAALAGGFLLALAGLLFVQYSIQRGWITPAMRVALAGAAGVASMLGSGRLFARGYRHAANALFGAGAVMLFGALWAGNALFALFGFGRAFAGMIAVTVACGAAALRRPSLVVAVFALAGGFATPLLLSLGSHQPLGLFAYLLALDLALVALSRKRRWSLLELLASVGTLLVFLVFILAELEPAEVPLALGFLGLSALVLVLPGLASGARSRRASLAGAALALLAPFPLALYLATRADLGEQLLPLALLAATLNALAGLLARRTGVRALAAGAALGSVAVIGVWIGSVPTSAVEAWPLVLALALLAAVPHGLLELDLRRSRSPSSAAAPLSATGLAAAAIAAAGRFPELGALPLMAIALYLSALLLRQGHAFVRPALFYFAALVPGLVGFSLAAAAARLEPGFGPVLAWPWTAASVAIAALLALHATSVRGDPLRRAAWMAAALGGLMLQAGFLPRLQTLVGDAWELQLGSLALGALIAVGASGARSPEWLAVAALSTAGIQHLWARDAVPWGSGVLSALALQALSAWLFAAWPARSGERFVARSAAWIGAAFAPWLWLSALLGLFADYAPELPRSTPVVLLGLGAALGLLLAARSLAPRASGSVRLSALTAYAASALGFAALVLPREVERGIWTVAPALCALGLALAWRKLPHRALPIASAALLAWSTARLGFEVLMIAANDASWPRTGLPVIHWGTYAWGLSAVCAFAAARLLPGDGKASSWTITPATLAGLCGLLLTFLWLNLEVQNHFLTGDFLALAFERLPQRDAATSLAWALYALTLLLLGVRGKRSTLRWMSLGFFLAAILKVFLHDLGELQGLYRVASLLGLALSLLAVSLLYQRFVFRREEAAGAST